MKILALDSSGMAASVAVVEDENMLAEYTVNYKKTHSQTLLPMLDAAVQIVQLKLDTIDSIRQRDWGWRWINPLSACPPPRQWLTIFSEPAEWSVPLWTPEEIRYIQEFMGLKTDIWRYWKTRWQQIFIKSLRN